MRVPVALTVLTLSTAGCKKPQTTLTGSLGDITIDAASAYWGSSYIVINDGEQDCLDMSWVQYIYDEEHPPGTDDRTFLQFSFVDSDVVAGRYDVSGQSAVDANVVEFLDGLVTLHPARIGTITVDEIDKKQRVIGTYDLEFDEGTIKGDLGVDYCTNIKP